MKKQFKKRNKQQKTYCQICYYEIQGNSQSIKLCKCNNQICNECFNKQEKTKSCQKCQKLLSQQKSDQIKKTSIKNNETLEKSQMMKQILQFYNQLGLPIQHDDIFKIRIIQKNLVYVIGLAPSLSDEKDLVKEQYFGQYGKVNRIIIGKNNVYNGDSGPSYSAYLTYENQQQASYAIIAINDSNYKGRILRASYGTTKYCINFLKNQQCTNQECLYLHSIERTRNIFYKDEMKSKNIFQDQQIIALKNSIEHKNYLYQRVGMSSKDSVFPNMEYVLKRVLKEEMSLYGFIKEIENKKETIVASKIGWDYSESNQNINASNKNSVKKTRKVKGKTKKIDILNDNDSQDNKSIFSESSLLNDKYYVMEQGYWDQQIVKENQKETFGQQIEQKHTTVKYSDQKQSNVGKQIEQKQTGIVDKEKEELVIGKVNEGQKDRLEQKQDDDKDDQGWYMEKEKVDDQLEVGSNDQQDNQVVNSQLDNQLDSKSNDQINSQQQTNVQVQNHWDQYSLKKIETIKDESSESELEQDQVQEIKKVQEQKDDKQQQQINNNLVNSVMSNVVNIMEPYNQDPLQIKIEEPNRSRFDFAQYRKQSDEFSDIQNQIQEFIEQPHWDSYINQNDYFDNAFMDMNRNRKSNQYQQQQQQQYCHSCQNCQNCRHNQYQQPVINNIIINHKNINYQINNIYQNESKRQEPSQDVFNSQPPLDQMASQHRYNLYQMDDGMLEKLKNIFNSSYQ